MGRLEEVREKRQEGIRREEGSKQIGKKGKAEAKKTGKKKMLWSLKFSLGNVSKPCCSVWAPDKAKP